MKTANKTLERIGAGAGRLETFPVFTVIGIPRADLSAYR
jgi:hypothetical protein